MDGVCVYIYKYWLQDMFKISIWNIVGVKLMFINKYKVDDGDGVLGVGVFVQVVFYQYKLIVVLVYFKDFFFSDKVFLIGSVLISWLVWLFVRFQ